MIEKVRIHNSLSMVKIGQYKESVQEFSALPLKEKMVKGEPILEGMIDVTKAADIADKLNLCVLVVPFQYGEDGDWWREIIIVDEPAELSVEWE